MVKGCQREMILMQTKDSATFECAYFVLRKGREYQPQEDMVAEANRILAREQGRRKRRGGWRSVLLFLGGVVLGAALFALSCAVMP